MLEPLAFAGQALQKQNDWPTRDQLQDLFTDKAVVSGSGQRIRLAPSANSHLDYEARCFLTGELETRENNWHDLLNALVWLTFPKAKAAINARHYAARGVANEQSMRGPERDALTLFDESGVIVVSDDASLLALVQNFSWKELFVHRREDVIARMRFYIFGHGLYEQALQPFVGLTGKAMLLNVQPSFLNQTFDEQLSWVDQYLADLVSKPENLRHPRTLSPLPILGIPNWFSDNVNEAFYDNTHYFRPGRRKQSTQESR